MDAKTIVVTGATSGIGEATARKLAALGHRVFLTGRNRAKLDALKRDLSAGASVGTATADLAVAEEARALAAEAIRTFGSVDVLVHSAGIFRMGGAELTSAEEFKRVLDTNLTSLQHLMRDLLPHFYERRSGHVVAISSIAGRVGYPAETAYCSSKWGLMGYLSALRMEAGERGVRVTAIMPGPTLTPEWEASKGEIIPENMLRPEDVAETVAFAVGQPQNSCIEELLIMPSLSPFARDAARE